MKKILVLGSNGQLGSELRAIHHKYQEYNFIFSERAEIDINESGIKEKIASLRPAYVINCAAYTAVDKAENDVLNCMRANAYAPGFIAQACKEVNAILFHISSDYVYDNNNKRPITENDPTTPKNIYAISKLQGEQLALNFNPKTYIIRSSWIYSSYGHNFVKTMLRLSETKTEISVVDDQFGAPTFARDLAEAIIHIIHANKNEYGIYNFANEGVVSWNGFAQEIFRLTNKKINILPISTEAFNAPASRPRWSVLSMNKIKRTFGIEIRHWKDALKQVISELN